MRSICFSLLSFFLMCTIQPIYTFVKFVVHWHSIFELECVCVWRVMVVRNVHQVTRAHANFLLTFNENGSRIRTKQCPNPYHTNVTKKTKTIANSTLKYANYIVLVSIRCNQRTRTHRSTITLLIFSCTIYLYIWTNLYVFTLATLCYLLFMLLSWSSSPLFSLFLNCVHPYMQCTGI